MIHVCFGLHDANGRYSKFTGTAITSLFENTTAPPPPSVTVHILHDNTLTQDNREKFVYLAGHYGQVVKFYNVEKLCADKIAEFWERIPAIKSAWSTIGTFFKLLIPQVLSPQIDKCIYLDSDMLVNLDVNELWRVELGNKPLAAVRESEANTYNYKNFDAALKYLLNEGIVKYKNYFNAGLLVMNLKYLRNAEAVLMSGVKWRGEHTQCNCFDQDIWNYLFSKNYIKLPVKFDRFICNERSQGITQIESAIYHYSNPTLGLNANDPFNRLWMNYFVKTPWFGEETIQNLYDGMRQMHINFKTELAQLSAAMSGKTRVFVILPQNLEATKQIFFISDDEEIIFVESEVSLPKLIDTMNQGRDKKIFIVLLPGFPFNFLTDAGFVMGKDFLDGMNFLSEANGVPLNSYPIVQSM